MLSGVLHKNQQLFGSGLSTKQFTASLLSQSESSKSAGLLTLGETRVVSDKENVAQLQTVVADLVQRVAANAGKPANAAAGSCAHMLLNYLCYVNVDINRDYGTRLCFVHPR